MKKTVINNILIPTSWCFAHLFYKLKLQPPSLKLRNLGQKFKSSLSQRVSELDALHELLIFFQLLPHVVTDSLVNFEDIAIAFLLDVNVTGAIQLTNLQ